MASDMTDKVTTNAHARERKERIVYTAGLLAEILDRVAMGEPLSRICSTEDMPTRKAFFDWVGKDTSIRAQYELAIQMRADIYAEDILAIADEVDVEAKYDGEEVTLQLDATAVARNKLRVDARKWLASKMSPKRYGDRQQVDLNDVTPPKPIDEVRSRLAELLVKAEKR
jgi:hypothetical protein